MAPAKLGVVDDQPVSALLHPLLASRRSPASFDAIYELSGEEVDALLEAARWAPSAGNSQPWSFIVARRGDTAHERMVRHITGSAAKWAPSASLLVANLSHRYIEDTDWDYSEFSLYDLGQAVALMTVQAQALGLAVRQFRAFDQAAMAAEFAVPAHWELALISAYGRPQPTADGSDLAPDRAPRQRRSLSELRWPPAD